MEGGRGMGVTIKGQHRENLHGYRIVLYCGGLLDVEVTCNLDKCQWWRTDVT